jgi:uncharacterized protein YjbI with pentapeptide repeats
VIDNLEQYYKVLGLEPGASLEEVNQAYKDLVFIWHPDRLPKDNQRLIQKSVEKLQQINQARDSLRSFHRENKTNQAKQQPATKTYSNQQQAKPYYSASQRTYTGSSRQQAQSYYRPPQDYYYQQTQSYYRDRPNSYSAPRQSTPSHKSDRDVGNTYQRPYYKDMRGVDLSQSNLKEKDLSGRNLSQANLSYADLSDSFLHKIILEEANLKGANLKGANLLQANLRKANLQEANLIGADLSGSDLSGANLSGAKVGFNNKIMVKLTAVKLTGAILPDGSVHP